MTWPLRPPLSDTELREIDELVALVGIARYGGWCWDAGGVVSVDVLGHDGKLERRHPGKDLRQALRRARDTAETARAR